MTPTTPGESPTTGPSRRDPALRRAAVLDAAQALFVEQGIARTSVEQIARRAGVAKGTVYLYFATKDDLAAALEERFTVGIVRAAHDAAAAAGPDDRIEAWAVAMAMAYRDSVDLHDMLFYGWITPSRDAADDNPLIGDLAGWLPAVDGVAPELVAAFLVGGVTQLVDRSLVSGVSTEAVDAAVRATVRAVNPGVRSRSSQGS